MGRRTILESNRACVVSTHFIKNLILVEQIRKFLCSRFQFCDELFKFFPDVIGLFLIDAEFSIQFSHQTFLAFEKTKNPLRAFASSSEVNQDFLVDIDNLIDVLEHDLISSLSRTELKDFIKI